MASSVAAVYLAQRPNHPGCLLLAVYFGPFAGSALFAAGRESLLIDLVGWAVQGQLHGRWSCCGVAVF